MRVPRREQERTRKALGCCRAQARQSWLALPLAQRNQEVSARSVRAGMGLGSA